MWVQHCEDFFSFFLYRGFFYDERRLLLARELLGLRASLHFLIGALWASAFVEGADLYGPFRRRGCVKKESCYANAREWKNNSGERERERRKCRRVCVIAGGVMR